MKHYKFLKKCVFSGTVYNVGDTIEQSELREYATDMIANGLITSVSEVDEGGNAADSGESGNAPDSGDADDPLNAFDTAEKMREDADFAGGADDPSTPFGKAVKKFKDRKYGSGGENDTDPVGENTPDAGVLNGSTNNANHPRTVVETYKNAKAKGKKAKG